MRSVAIIKDSSDFDKRYVTISVFGSYFILFDWHKACLSIESMSVFLRVLLGIIVMFVGFLIVAKTEKVYSMFGSNDFAEKTFGYGGSRFFYKLIGVLAVFIGIFIATNIISDILTSLAMLLSHK